MIKQYPFEKDFDNLPTNPGYIQVWKILLGNTLGTSQQPQDSDLHVLKILLGSALKTYPVFQNLQVWKILLGSILGLIKNTQYLSMKNLWGSTFELVYKTTCWNESRSHLHRQAKIRFWADFKALRDMEAPKFLAVMRDLFFLLFLSFFPSFSGSSSANSSSTKTRGFTDFQTPSESRSWWLNSIFTSTRGRKILSFKFLYIK